MQRLFFLAGIFFVVFLGLIAPVCAQDHVQEHGSSDPLHIRFDTAFWAVVVFVTLLLILRAKAWGPILEGLQKREESIRSSLEEAKKTRVDMEQMRLQFQKELAEAHQQIPKLMEEARKKGEEMTNDMLAKASAQIQGDRDRLRRELELAKDQALKELWDQSAQLATLISAKALGRAINADDHRRLIDEALREMGQATTNQTGWGNAFAQLPASANPQAAMGITMIEPKEQFADVSVQRLARVYAVALLDAAEHTSQVPQVLEEIDSLIDDVFRADSRLETLFSSAVMGRKAREDALKKVFAAQASPVFLNFLLVLNHQERLDLVRPIRRAIHELYDERTRHLHVHVFSAIPLADEFREKISTAVRERFKLEPILDVNVDEKLLGGLRIRIGDRQYDATVLGRIDNLRNQLITSSSYEIQSQRDRFCSDSGN